MREVLHILEVWLGHTVIRHRWLILVLTLCAVSASAFGISRLTFLNDSRMFFSKENPQLQALEELERTYTKVENILFVVMPASGTLFEKETLQALIELTEASWTLPYSNRVDSLINFQHTRAEDDELVVEDLVPADSILDSEEIHRIREIALHEPTLRHSLISPEGAIGAVNVNITKPGKQGDETAEVSKAARELKRQIEKKYSDLTIMLTGGVMIDNAFGEAPQRDIRSLLPLMFIVLLFLLALFLRSILAMGGTLLVIVMATLTALGLAGWLGIILTPASANAPTIILTLAVADSIHLLTSMLQQMRQGRSRHDAIREALRINLQPVFITSVTTAIGFLTMNFSDAPPFRDLGNIVAIGVMAAFLYSVFFLPALMAVLPIVPGREDKFTPRMLHGFAEFVVARQTPIFWSILLLIILLSAGIFRIRLNDDFVAYFDKSFDFRVASDIAADHLAGMEIIDWNLDSGEEGGINDPKFLNTIEAFSNWLRAQPEARHVYTLADTMKRLNQNMHGDDPSWYRIPQNRELAAQYLLLYELSLPFGLDLNNRINLDKSAIRLTVSMPNIGTAGVLALEERGRQWLQENAPELVTYGSGLSVIFSHISERNIRAMLRGSILALLLISLTMIVALGDVRLGLLSLIPNLTPSFMAFGIWGLVVGQVGLAVSVMIAMTLGIVVDDTVHFLSKYQRARKEHTMSAEDAVRYAFKTVGSAIWITTVALVAGFTVLAFSGFQINKHMGAMTAITVVLALIMDFFFLPSLLMKLDTKS